MRDGDKGGAGGGGGSLLPVEEREKETFMTE